MAKLHGITVTLETADTAYNLYTIVSAVDGTVRPISREVAIQNDPGNAGAEVRIGDADLASDYAGMVLLTGDVRTYSWRPQGVDTRDIYVMGDTNSTVVNVEMADF